MRIVDKAKIRDEFAYWCESCDIYYTLTRRENRRLKYTPRCECGKHLLWKEIVRPKGKRVWRAYL